MTTIAIVDYGAGNLRSIHKALEHVIAGRGSAITARITADPAVIAALGHAVPPGKKRPRRPAQAGEFRAIGGGVREIRNKK